jgi:hypothetical protein
MERNYWKLATIGIALTGVTALSTGLTTAWMLRPAEEAQAQAAPVMATPTAPPATRHVATVSPPPARVTPAVVRPDVTPSVARTDTPPRVTRVATTSAADCSTGGERAIRIAKPGAIGALLGAGLGAGGGAIADGGKGAGKGALIGGLAGAALGAGYGAYKTQNECGTIFGNSKAFDAAPTAHADEVQAMAPAAAAGGDRIQVYGVQR